MCQGADRGPLVSGLGVSRRTRCAISTRTGPPPALGPPGDVILLRYDCVNIARGVRLATGAPASERGTPRGDGLPRSNATKTTPEQDHDDAKRGDRAALGRLLAAHRPMLVTIFRAFAPLGAVRDLVAAANAKAVAAFPRQHGGVRALAEWLRRVARSVWIDALRKHAPETAAARRREVRGTQRTAAADRRWRAEDGDAAPRRSDFARRVAEVQARDEERTARGLPRAIDAAGKREALAAMCRAHPGDAKQLAADARLLEEAFFADLGAPFLRDRSRRREVWRRKPRDERIKQAIAKLRTRDWQTEAADVERAIAQAQRLAKLRRLLRPGVDGASTAWAEAEEEPSAQDDRRARAILKLMTEIEENQALSSARFREEDGTERWAHGAERPLGTGTVADLRDALVPQIDRRAALAVIDRVLQPTNEHGDWGELRLRYPDINFGRGRKGWILDRRIRDWLHSHGLNDAEIGAVQLKLARDKDPLADLLKSHPTRSNASRARRRLRLRIK